MKRLLVTVLAIILSFEPLACYASSYDGLAIAIDEMVKNNDELKCLSEIYNIKPEKIENKSYSELALLFNKKIRHGFGHTVVNLFRNEYEPDYSKMLIDTLDNLDLLEEEEKKTISDAEAEERIFAYIMQQTKERILKEKGIAAWEEVSHEIDKEAKKLLDEGSITQNEYDKLVDGFMSASITGGLAMAHFSGILVYQIGTKLFWAAVRQLGLHVAMTVGTPLATSAVGVMMGPVGIIAAGLLDVYLLGKTNWPRTYSALALVSAHNMQKRYQAELKKRDKGEEIEQESINWLPIIMFAVLLIVALILFIFFRKIFWLFIAISIVAIVLRFLL